VSALGTFDRPCVALAFFLILAGWSLADDLQPRLEDIPWRAGTPSEKPERVERQSGNGSEVQIRVERIWREGKRTHAAVTLRNTARFEFHDLKLRCTAFDVRSAAIGVEEQALTHERYGTMKPGFAAKLDFVFDTPAVEVRSLTCIADVRGVPRRLAD
jgi:hypothetical protein